MKKRKEALRGMDAGGGGGVLNSLETEDFLETSHILSWLVQLKSILFNLLCVLDLPTHLPSLPAKVRPVLSAHL